MRAIRSGWLAALVAVCGLIAAGEAVAGAVQAKLSAGAIDVGATVTLVVTVSDARGGVGDPAFEVPRGLVLLGSTRGTNFSFINGSASTSHEFRYELGGSTPGRYSIGPIRIRVDNQVYQCAALPLVIGQGAPAAGPSVSTSGGNSRAPATLVLDVQPPHPYVGELVTLAVRLVQRQQLADASQYQPPPTPGFWAESYGDPRQYEGRENGRVVMVTESRTRLYPLAAGVATIGQAAEVIVPGSSGGMDPFFGGAPVRPMAITSDSLRVAVRPLPPGAPPAFDGAVGDFRLSWGLDRSHTAQDQPLTLELDVRGVGNLPLLHAPALAPGDFEIFASTVQDSLAPSGERGVGRRRFQWTLMPRKAGTLRIEPVAFAWFDPGSGSYHNAALPPLTVEVLAAGAASANSSDDAFPPALAQHPAEPGARTAQPWLFLVAGVCAGLAVRFWRRSGQPDALAAERGRQREWLRAVGLARGADFWKAADEAVLWVESRGGQVLRLREDIAAARYGGQFEKEEDVRRRLVERLGEALPAAAPMRPWRAFAIALGVLALLAWFLGAPQHGDARRSARALGADGAARTGQSDAARAEWERLWSESPGDPRLAARLAWSELRRDSLARAAVWALRGAQGDARDPALTAVTERVREAGGLSGAHVPGLPIRMLEWAALASALAIGCLLEWPRRWSAALLALLAVLAAAAPALVQLWRESAPVAVVERQVPLAGAGLDLDAGQVVRVLRVHGDAVRVTAGHELSGELPLDALTFVREGK